MFRFVCHVAGTLIIVLISCLPARSEDAAFGTAEEARAMLDRAVAALKSDKNRALASFNAHDGAFRDRDLYVACADREGKVTAHPDKSILGKDRTTMADANGKPFGLEVQLVAEEDRVSEVTYVYPRPGTSAAPVQKNAFVTRVGDQICLVGYYVR